jgi:hypothetical protein
VHCLDNAQIWLAGDGLFQLEAGRAALERSTLPIVLNDHDRVAAPAPRGNQLGDVLLGVGIVAGSELWILESALNVDDQERTLPDHALTLPQSRCRALAAPHVLDAGCAKGRGRHGQANQRQTERHPEQATLVRGLLLPAVMTLLGERNWYLPRRLERLMTREPHEVKPRAVPVPHGK